MSDFVDKAKHKAEEITGEAKTQVGEATGNDELRDSGTAQKAKGNAHRAADTAVAKAREIDVDTVVETAKSPRMPVIAAALASGGVVAVLIGRRNRRRRSPAAILRRGARSKSRFGR